MSKLISFCTAKETIKKEQVTYRLGKIFANNVTKKGLISKIHNQLTQFNNNNNETQKKNG